MSWPKEPLSRTDVEAHVADFPAPLRPIKDAVLGLSAAGGWREGGAGGPIVLGHRPDIAPEAYDIVLWEPLCSDLLGAYQERQGVPVPPSLAQLLTHVNGCQMFGLDIYGAPMSMAGAPPLLSRGGRAALDIANGRDWRASYGRSDPAAVLFASRNVSGSGQVGYFISEQGAVSAHGNGDADAPHDCGSWPDLGHWLADVIPQSRSDPR
jgi:hypothetical protein